MLWPNQQYPAAISTIAGAAPSEFVALVWTDCPRAWAYMRERIWPDDGWHLDALARTTTLSSIPCDVDTSDNCIHHLHFYYPPNAKSKLLAGTRIPFATHLAYAQKQMVCRNLDTYTIIYENPIQIPGCINAFTAVHKLVRKGITFSNQYGALPLLYNEATIHLLAPYNSQGMLPPRPVSRIPGYPQPCHKGFCPWNTLCDIVSHEQIRKLSIIKTWRNR
jgi:hypothetical protein